MSEDIRTNEQALSEEELNSADGGYGYPVGNVRRTCCPTSVYSSPGNPAAILVNLPANNPVQIIGACSVPGYVRVKTLYPNEGFTGFVMAAHLY